MYRRERVSKAAIPHWACLFHSGGDTAVAEWLDIMGWPSQEGIVSDRRIDCKQLLYKTLNVKNK